MKRKTILVITGSPRARGNTEQLSDSFIRGAEKAGHEIERFSAAQHQILGCTACEQCWTGGNPCRDRDDFDQLYPLLEKAEVLVLATPLYWFTFSMQLKAALDKLYPYTSPTYRQRLKVRETLLLACAGDTDPTVMEGLTASYQKIIRYMGWKDRGMLLVPGVYEIGDIENTEAMRQAREMGEEL